MSLKVLSVAKDKKEKKKSRFNLYAKKNKTKITVTLLSALFSVLMFVVPLIVVASAVAAPIIAISNFFQDVGDFMFGSGQSNPTIELIDQYIEKSGSEAVTRYKPFVEQLTDKKYEYLLIPVLLAGIEEPSDDLLNHMLELANNQTSEEKLDLTLYIEDLKQLEEFEVFLPVTTTTIVGYIDYYKDVLSNIVLDPLSKEFLEQFKGHEFIYPFTIKADVTSETFQQRSYYVEGQGWFTDVHTGIDLAFPAPNQCGMPIYAVQDGKVTKNERTTDQLGANWGEVTYSNLKVWYVHLLNPFPHEVGTEIKRGDFVGYVGTSGQSTGCHLHLEMRVDNKVVNPRNFIEFDNPILP